MQKVYWGVSKSTPEGEAREWGCGQRVELNCEVVAIKASDDPSKELWSWDHLSVLFQLEARGLGFRSYTSHINLDEC